MSEHELTRAQDELLLRIASGEVAVADAAVQAAAADPRFRAALDQVLALQRDLDATAALEREWQALGAAAPPQPDYDAAVLRALRGAADSSARWSAAPSNGRPFGPPAPGSNRTLLAFAAAAIVLLALSWWLSDGDVDLGDDRRTLGPARLELDAAQVGDGGRVELGWRALQGLRFVVKIVDPAAPGAAPLRELETEDRRWVLEANELPRARGPLRWAVQAFDPSGVLLEEREAALPPPRSR